MAGLSPQRRRTMDRVSFLLNGEPHSVGGEVSSNVMLLDYLREGNNLRGTKYLCREGGCGACVVAAARPGEPPHAVNSVSIVNKCLVAITSCQDWEITTVEGVGSRLHGYHRLQKTLAKYNGTQCGYCSPGWIMAMYSLLQIKKNLTMLEIEQSFASNICRCTGYRPILEAFKTFSSDSPDSDNLLDIEDLKICKKSNTPCASHCSEYDWCLLKAGADKNLEIKLKDERLWFRVRFVDDIFQVLKDEGDDCYMLVAGNTAKGAYPIDAYPRVLIDISGINVLKGHQIDQNLELGAGNTLTETMETFASVAQTEDSFWYLEKLRQHLLLVAHIPVRNLGTVAGNLMTKHAHNDFPSDVFLLLETVGAYLTIMDSSGTQERVTPEAFLKVDMKGKVILNILLPPLSREYKFVSFKIMPRAQNAHAIVNAGFLFKLNEGNEVSEVRIVYGGLSPQYVHAKETEEMLVGRKLFSNDTLQAALKLLDKELVVVENPPEPSVKYRKNLALNLFYKALLYLAPSNLVNSRFASGGITLSHTRPVSKARQVYTTNPLIYPLNQPIEKVDALIQCAGEALYTEDLPSLPREVFGAFVLSTIAVGDIAHIDASEALDYPGVVAFYTAKDIPGVNSFTFGDNIAMPVKEEVFCSGAVEFHGQVIGLVVAESRQIAEIATKLIKVTYNNVGKPVVDIKEAMKNSRRVTVSGEYTQSESSNVDVGLIKVIKGGDTIYAQHHFCMETMVCVTKPTEEGMEVHCATQYMDSVQIMIARALNLTQNKVDVRVRRLGGSYGVKISRCNQAAVACALATHLLERPCRMMLPLTTFSKTVGKRLPCSTDYEVAVDIFGKMIYCKQHLYLDNGYVFDEPVFLATLDSFNNCYEKLKFSFKIHNVTTNTASNTWCRSPGYLESIASSEFLMERIAYELSKDPLEVRLKNLNPLYSALRLLVLRVKSEGQYEERRAAVDKFNAQNRWKKRGLRFTLLRWTPTYPPYFGVTMSVYHEDGTVAITHGGIDMGQGLNTKAVQIAAFFLKIPIEKIQIKENNTIASPNNFVTGDSSTSIIIGIGVRRCCEELLLRLAPFKLLLPLASWEEQIKAAFLAGIDLQTHGFVSYLDIQRVPVFGVSLAEVEIDVLTGEWEILRVDIVEDVGQSVSPQIDVGQVEGAFVMGLGYWTTEHLVYDQKTGELLTNRTWNYYVPQARDIPQDFRVYFRDKSYSEPRILGAKSVGEPPICLSLAVLFAMREGIAAAREDTGKSRKDWFQIDGPFTREAIQLNTATDFTEFKFS